MNNEDKVNFYINKTNKQEIINELKQINFYNEKLIKNTKWNKQELEILKALKNKYTYIIKLFKEIEKK